MRTGKRSIAGTMWWVFYFAIGLALLRGRPGVSRWVAYLYVLPLGVSMLPWLLLVLVPKISMRLARGNRDRQRRILRWVVATPFPGRVKVLARFMLGINEQVGRRYEEAEATLRSIVDDGQGRLDPGFESAVRQRLADTIDALGRREEAADERKRAAAALGGGEETILGWQSRGKLLDRQHRYDEAVLAYERALELAPAGNNPVRVQLMMHLVLSAFNAARPADTVRWAEAVIELDPDGPRNHGARRMAAVGYGNLGRLDDAERHVRLAIERSPSGRQRAESLALLGDYLMRRGDLDEAERIACEAEALLPGQKRLPWLVIGNIAKLRGHYEEAIRVLEHARTIEMGHIPASNRRMNAAIDKELAVLHAELGHGDDALALIRAAESELVDDPKLAVSLDAAAALVHAFGHDRDRAFERFESADEGRARVPQDGTTQREVLGRLGRAALLLDELDLAEEVLREYLDHGPDPVFHPFAWYYLGECRRRLGDEAGGRECDRKAASARFGTLWERLARERLAAEGAAV